MSFKFWVLFWMSALLLLVSSRSDGSYGDLAAVYGSTRCIYARCDPYIVSVVQDQLLSHGARATEFIPPFWAEHQPDYPPLTFDLLAPMFLWDYPTAGKMYFWTSALALIASGLLTILLCPPQARTVTLLGVCGVLMTSGVLLRLGQVSTLTIAFLVSGSMLFLNRRQLPIGAVLLFLSAGLKPQLAVPMIVFFALLPTTRRYALGALGGFVLATACACIALTHRLHSTEWVQDFIQRVHSAVPVRIDTGLVNLSAMTQLLNSNPVVFRSIDLIVFALLGAFLCVALIRTGGDMESQWVMAAAMCFVTLLIVYHRTYDMRIQMLSFPALGMLWRKSWKLALVLTILASMMLSSTALRLEHWATLHFGPQIARDLLFRLLVERQQAVIVLVASVMWTIAAVQTASRRPLVVER